MSEATSNTGEYDKFDATMDTLLKANPQVIKSAMAQEKREREEERKAKRLTSSPASSIHD